MGQGRSRDGGEARLTSFSKALLKQSRESNLLFYGLPHSLIYPETPSKLVCAMCVSAQNRPDPPCMFMKRPGGMPCRSEFCPRKNPRFWRANTAGRSRLRKAMSMAKHGADAKEHRLNSHRSELTSIRGGSGRLTSNGRDRIQPPR